ncbi:MAG: hypothetical protein ACTSYM_06905 [Candidatus Baldrarchaeia archaeon]
MANQRDWEIDMNGQWVEWNWTIEDWVKDFWANATAEMLDTIWLNGTPTPLNMTEDVKEEIITTEKDGRIERLAIWNIHIDKLKPNGTIKVGYTIKIDSVEDALNRTEMDIPDEYEENYVRGLEEMLLLVEDDLRQFVIKHAKKAAENIQEFLDTATETDPEAFHFGIEFGPMVVFHDNIGHEYFVMANGYVTQFNDEEPVIIPVVTLDDYSLLIGQTTNVTCTIYNYGNADATDVAVEFVHAIVDQEVWTLK